MSRFSRGRLLFYAAGALVFVASRGFADEEQSRPAITETAHHKYALLVGCTKYDNHDNWTLQGPANDVVLLRQVLADHFGFDDSQPDKYIVTLAEGSDAQHRPTKANIQREFQRLAQEAQVDDQVIILLSGHGSRQPETASDNPLDHKLDGQEEIFLPADTGFWSDADKSIKNVVVDHQLRRWIDDITKSGAHVWVIVDSCHSGTMIRGADAEKSRDVPEDSLIPPSEIEQAKKLAKQRSANLKLPPGTSGERLPMGFAAKMPNRVGLYAAQSSETAPELPLPVGQPGAKPHGLLTFTLCQILTPKSDQPRDPLTYREVGQRIRAAYAAMGRVVPTPLVEGSDASREVLGLREWPERSRIEFRRSGNQCWITAGKLLGLNVGSILAVIDSSNHIAGHVRVTDVGATSSEVVPCEYDKTAKNDKLPDRSPCELKFLNFDSRPLVLTVDEDPPPDLTSEQRRHWQPNSARLSQLRAALKPLENEPGSLVKFTDDAAGATWRLVVEKDQCFLSPSCGVLRTDESSNMKIASDNPLFGPYAADPKTILDTLRDKLGRIARAQALLSMAGQPSAELAADGPGSVRMEVKLFRFKDRSDKVGEELKSDAGIQLHPGDLIAFRLQNTGQRDAIYPALLFIDSGYGIKSFYPDEGYNAEPLVAGASLWSSMCQVNGDTTGQEHLVAIGVKASEPPDFSIFAQPTLERTKRGASEQCLLEKLMASSMFHEGQTRGATKVEIGDFALAHIAWQTKPAADP